MCQTDGIMFFSRLQWSSTHCKILNDEEKQPYLFKTRGKKSVLTTFHLIKGRFVPLVQFWVLRPFWWEWGLHPNCGAALTLVPSASSVLSKPHRDPRVRAAPHAALMNAPPFFPYGRRKKQPVGFIYSHWGLQILSGTCDVFNMPAFL